ncbi:hypothetical protein AAC387_Pa04g0623 [Persea americana]
MKTEPDVQGRSASIWRLHYKHMKNGRRGDHKLWFGKHAYSDLPRGYGDLRELREIRIKKRLKESSRQMGFIEAFSLKRYCNERHVISYTAGNAKGQKERNY